MVARGPLCSLSRPPHRLLPPLLSPSCTAGAALGPAHLFFGCRTRAHDFLYEAELEGAVGGGALSRLHAAFSRERAQKEYVQHLMEAHAAEVWGLLSDDGEWVG